MWLASPALPVGGFSYSEGLEAAVEAGLLTTEAQAGDWLLLFTDGLNEMLQLPVLLPEWTREPATLCSHLLRQWRSGRDDAGVLVLQVLADGAC